MRGNNLMDLYAIYSDRLRTIKEGLSIADKQTFKWARFEASVKATLNIAPKSARSAVQEFSNHPPLPAALGIELQKTLFRVEACRALLESVDALYAVLSEKQRRLADRLLSPVLSDVLTGSPELRGPKLAA